MNKKYLILGLGKSGESIKKYFENKNINYLAFDDNKMKEEESFEDVDVLIKSPGIRNDERIVSDFLDKKKKIVTDLELLSEYLGGKKTICVTGTNGKSTAVTLLKSVLPDYELVGNIGVPIFDKLDSDKNLIIECSSYMCEYISEFKPDYTILLNIYPNHLDHHLTFSNYILSKGKLIRNTKKIICYNYDDFYTNSLIAKVKEENTHCTYLSFSTKNPKADLYLLDSNIYFGERYICSLLDLNPYLQAYPENVLATILLCIAINKPCVNYKFSNFKGLEHRLELFYSNNNLKFYNDSKSTNIYALNRAIKVFKNDKVVLICGGFLSKGKYDESILYQNNVKEIFITGDNKNHLKKLFIESGYSEDIISLYDELEDTVKKVKMSEEERVVLFSPGSQSFDKYNNFEERGKAFKELVFKYY